MSPKLSVPAGHQSLLRNLRNGDGVSIQQAQKLNKFLNKIPHSEQKLSLECERDIIESVSIWLNRNLPDKLFENHPPAPVLRLRDKTFIDVAESLTRFASYAYQLSADRSQNKSIVDALLKPALLSYALAAAKHGFKGEALFALDQHNFLTTFEEEINGSISLRDTSFPRAP